MSVYPGNIEYRIVQLGEMYLYRHNFYKSFEDFMSTPHRIKILEQECIDSYKKHYQYLYLHPQRIIFAPPALFKSWYVDRLKIMKMMVDLPEEVVRKIIDEESKM